jgi:hypothetical protein
LKEQNIEKFGRSVEKAKLLREQITGKFGRSVEK